MNRADIEQEYLNSYHKGIGCLRIVVFFILFLFALILLFGCEKEDDTYCYDCIITFYWHRGYEDDLLFKVDTVEKCGYSERDAQLFEKQRTTKPYVISICGGDYRWEECICEIQNQQK